MTWQTNLKKIHLTDDQLVGRGAAGAVYRINDETIVKLYNANPDMAEIRHEKEVAREAFKLGVPTAISFEMVDCDGRLGIVYELLDTKTLSQVLGSDAAHVDGWVRRYAQLMLDINSIHCDSSSPAIPSIQQHLDELIDKSSPLMSAQEMDAYHRLVHAVPECHTLVHGDLHPKNIMVAQDELITIDIADLSYGHPVFDLGAVYVTTQINPEAVRLKNLDLSMELSDTVWNRLLYWYFALAGGPSQATEATLARHLRSIVPYALLKIALVPVLVPTLDKATIDGTIKMAREHLLPHIDQMIANLDFDEWPTRG